MIEKPFVSIIIPTHNRQHHLKRTLDAIREQTYPLQSLEVVVVADGCVDDTVAMLNNYRAPFTFRFIDQPCRGAAAARNRGANDANGALLVFLDDDVEPAPHLVQAHANAHREPNQVVVGYYAPIFQDGSGFFFIGMAAWWEEKFYTMRRPGHRYTYEDLLSGNFSLSAKLFRSVGGFDTALRMREDYELGFRLLSLGAQLIHDSAAVGYHRDTGFDLNKSLLRKRHEGQADTLFGLRHPVLKGDLRLSRFGASAPYMERLLVRSVFRMPKITGLVARGLQRILAVMEDLRMRCLWRTLNERLHGYWYLRGVVDELKTYERMIEYLRNGHHAVEDTELELDLQHGLNIAEKQLDEVRPMSICIRYGKHLVGRIPSQAGTERLRGSHLRPFLVRTFPLQLLQAIALQCAAEGMTNAQFLSSWDCGGEPDSV